MASGGDFRDPITTSPYGMHGRSFEVTLATIWRKVKGFEGGWQCIELRHKPKKGWCKSDDKNWKHWKVFRNFQPSVVGWIWKTKDSEEITVLSMAPSTALPRWMDGGAVCWDGRRTQFGGRTWLWVWTCWVLGPVRPLRGDARKAVEIRGSEETSVEEIEMWGCCAYGHARGYNVPGREGC